MNNLPIEFKKRSRALFDSDEEYEKFISAMEESDNVRALRVNTLKISEADFLEKYGEEYSLSPYGYGRGYSFSFDSVGSEPTHHAGQFYVQDPGAMATVAAAEEYIKPDFRVLDMCSAPGGKSTQLAALLGDGDGLLVSNEINFKRANILRSNTERMGHKRTVVVSAPPKTVAEDFNRYFDFVLVDAPCSGEGMMRKYEEAISEWSVENVEMCAARQADILESAHKCVAPNGYLLYSTCTFNLEENEKTVNVFVKKHPEYEILPVSNAICNVTADGIEVEGGVENLKYCRRFYPHVSSGEGQFLCLMKKRGEGERGEFPQKKNVAKPIPKADLKTVKSFLDSVLEAYPQPMLLGETVMLSGSLPCPKYTLCCGVAVGEITKGRIVPHHHLFSAYGKDFKNKVELSGEQSIKYISGETVPVPAAQNGWCAVTADGSPLGGAKAVDGTLKNHYPKGLRQRK